MKLIIFDFAGTIDAGQKNEADIIESIKNLSGKYILAIISSTPSFYIKNYLEKKNILSGFSDVLGPDFSLGKKRRIKNLLSKHNILPSDAVFITDTENDVMEANECGIKSIGVSWGLNDEKILKNSNPTYLINNPKELITIINNMLK